MIIKRYHFSVRLEHVGEVTDWWLRKVLSYKGGLESYDEQSHVGYFVSADADIPLHFHATLSQLLPSLSSEDSDHP